MNSSANEIENTPNTSQVTNPEYNPQVPQTPCNPNVPDELDDDLNSLEVSPSLVMPQQTTEPRIIISENLGEGLGSILEACNTASHTLRKTISDSLTSRDSVVITEIDPLSDLEASLNEKIADFEKTVSDCQKTDIVNAAEEFVANEECLQEKVPESNVCESKDLGEMKNLIQDMIKSKILESQDKEPSPSRNVPTTETTTATKNSSEDKSLKKQKNLSKRKAEKSMDQLMKFLNGYPTSEEKLQALCRRHAEVLEEGRAQEARLRQMERHVASQQKEKEQLQSEHNRLVLAKSRLEGLCRELQKQNKAIKEESLLRVKEEEEKRKEVTTKFQTTLNDISTLVQENSKKNAKLQNDNNDLSTKLKSLVDHYEIYEQNMSKVIQQKELEAQLAKAKHAKVNLVLKQETEKFLKEKQSLLENLSELQSRCTQLTTNELHLRTELNDYTAKYEEFQGVLNNSSKVFANFKSDMDATSKRIKKMEKETNVYKQKWESSNKALVEMISCKEKRDTEFLNAQQRIALLEKLCRALQTERNELQSKLNSYTSGSSENDIEVSVQENKETEAI